MTHCVLNKLMFVLQASLQQRWRCAPRFQVAPGFGRSGFICAWSLDGMPIRHNAVTLLSALRTMHVGVSVRWYIMSICQCTCTG